MRGDECVFEASEIKAIHAVEEDVGVENREFDYAPLAYTHLRREQMRPRPLVIEPTITSTLVVVGGRVTRGAAFLVFLGLGSARGSGR